MPRTNQPLLDITVEPEDFDGLAGVIRRHRQVNHSEVVRLRNANPNESLETLAQRARLFTLHGQASITR
jgi:hypothetical protein